MARALSVVGRISFVLLLGALGAGCGGSGSNGSWSRDSGSDAPLDSGGPHADGSHLSDAGSEATSDAAPPGDASFDTSSSDSGSSDAATDAPASDSVAATVTAMPATLDFGQVILNEPSAKSVTVKNTGMATFTLAGANATGPGFSVSTTGLPMFLAAGQTKTFSVTFDPSASGPLSGDVKFITDVAGSADVMLSGVGIHAVTLNWNASTSADVVGYNVYRGTTSGGPYTKINTSLVQGTTYTDTTVQKCVTYYYVTTAVNSSGLESAYSNETVAAVPCT
jgi:Abnormal spindle-like microcephaly-assoc'd, ASPM-SPD-2-Hydin